MTALIAEIFTAAGQFLGLIKQKDSENNTPAMIDNATMQKIADDEARLTSVAASGNLDAARKAVGK